VGGGVYVWGEGDARRHDVEVAFDNRAAAAGGVAKGVKSRWGCDE